MLETSRLTEQIPFGEPEPWHAVLKPSERPHRPSPSRLPLFFNEIGASRIAIGVTVFECMGVLPPHDHPHVYLNISELAEILCPYCSTLYVYNPGLRRDQTEPANCYWSPAKASAGGGAGNTSH